MSPFNAGVHCPQIIPYILNMFWSNVDLHLTKKIRSGTNSYFIFSTMILSSLVRSVYILDRSMYHDSFKLLIIFICFNNRGRGDFNSQSIYVMSLGYLQFSKTCSCASFWNTMKQFVSLSSFTSKVDRPSIFSLNLGVLYRSPPLSCLRPFIFLLFVLVLHVPLIYAFMPLTDPLAPSVGQSPPMIYYWVSFSLNRFFLNSKTYFSFAASLVNALDMYRSIVSILVGNFVCLVCMFSFDLSDLLYYQCPSKKYRPFLQ